MYRLKKSAISKPFVSNVYSVKLTKNIAVLFFLNQKGKILKAF